MRVFEPRYLDMVSDCMKAEKPFGVLLLSEGVEVGDKSQVRTESIGTLATISDWYQGNDGVLGVTALGGDCFRVVTMQRQRDGLNVAEIETLPPEPAIALPAKYKLMSDLLRAVIDDLGRLYETIETHYDDASWVGYRFSEILPLSLADKQQCLEMRNPVARLEYLQPQLRLIREEDTQ